MQRRRRAREWLGRLGLLLFGLLLALLVLEAALQLGALVTRSTHARAATAAKDPSHFRIVCVGDSNTYGLFVEPDESYPSQLEQRLRELRPVPVPEVLNLGMPGLNSSRLLREFPELIETLAPDLVIVMVGVNDTWTDPTAEGAAAPPTLASFLNRHSRVLRLARLLCVRGRTDIEISVHHGASFEHADQWVRVGDRDFDFGFQRAHVGKERAEVLLNENLLRLHEIGEAAGARMLFMSYPGRYELYAIANHTIQQTARHGLPLLDLAYMFLEPCPFPKCPTLLFEDQHPTAEGYRLVAEKITSWILAQP